MNKFFFHELGHFIAETISLCIQGNTSFKPEIRIDKSPFYRGATLCCKSSSVEYRIASLLYGSVFEDLYNNKADLQKTNFIFCFEQITNSEDSDYEELMKIIKDFSIYHFKIYQRIIGEAISHLTKLKNEEWESHMKKIFNLKAMDVLILNEQGFYVGEFNSLMEKNTTFIKNHKAFFVEFTDKIRSILNEKDI